MFLKCFGVSQHILMCRSSFLCRCVYSCISSFVVVMCRLWPEARSRAKPGQKKPGQAGPDLWPEPAFGPAWDMKKPKPLAWAPAFVPYEYDLKLL